MCQCQYEMRYHLLRLLCISYLEMPSSVKTICPTTIWQSTEDLQPTLSLVPLPIPPAKTCNAMIPEVAMQPSTKIKPACTKRRQGVTEFSIVFMLNQTEQLQNRHAAYKQPTDDGRPVVQSIHFHKTTVIWAANQSFPLVPGNWPARGALSVRLWPFSETGRDRLRAIREKTNPRPIPANANRTEKFQCDATAGACLAPAL